MRAIILVLSTTLILIAIGKILVSRRGEKTLGLLLPHPWIVAIVVGELSAITALAVDYSLTLTSTSANDFLWYNLLIYYRGTFPAIGVMQLVDFRPLSNLPGAALMAYFSAIVCDYVLLKLATLIREAWR